MTMMKGVTLLSNEILNKDIELTYSINNYVDTTIYRLPLSEGS